MEKLDFLEKADIFNGLNRDQLAVVKDCCAEEEYQKGDRLFDNGEDANHLWIVMEGQIDLHFDRRVSSILKNKTISSLKPAMPFGWSGLVAPNRYRFSAYSATSTCKVVKIEKNDITQLFEKDSRLGYLVMSNLAKVVANRFHQLQSELLKHRGDHLSSNW